MGWVHSHFTPMVPYYVRAHLHCKVVIFPQKCNSRHRFFTFSFSKTTFDRQYCIGVWQIRAQALRSVGGVLCRLACPCGPICCGGCHRLCSFCVYLFLTIFPRVDIVWLQHKKRRGCNLFSEGTTKHHTYISTTHAKRRGHSECLLLVCVNSLVVLLRKQ